MANDKNVNYTLFLSKILNKHAPNKHRKLAALLNQYQKSLEVLVRKCNHLFFYSV
jgi:hypothetical protein